MRILGIETSCDDTSVAIVEDGCHVLSNLVSSQVEIHRPYGGVVPEIASRAHIENLQPLLHQLLQETGLSLDDIDAVAVTFRPGLVGCLLVGVSYAKALAYSLNIPLIGIHHLQAHVYTIALDRLPHNRPDFPHLSLLVSGGHTSIYKVNDWTQLSPIGRTVDDAAGEAFDKVAKLLDLGFPGGPVIQKRAQHYEGECIPLPRPMMNQGYDFSFSGLKTAVLNAKREKGNHEDGITCLAASFQDAAVDVLVTKTLRAAEEHGIEHISLVGGVSANQRLRDELTRRAMVKGLKVYLPDKRFSMDNGAMVAGLAYPLLLANQTADLTLNAYAI